MQTNPEKVMLTFSLDPVKAPPGTPPHPSGHSRPPARAPVRPCTCRWTGVAGRVRGGPGRRLDRVKRKSEHGSKVTLEILGELDPDPLKV